MFQFYLRIIFCLVLTSSTAIKIHGQSIAWERSFGGPNQVGAGQTALDYSGNVLSVGTFSGDGIFGSITIHPLSSTVGNGYVIKFDSTGNQLWVTPILALNHVYLKNVACDSLNNVYILGTNTGILIWAGDTIPAHESFLAKLDSAGNPIWAKRIFGRNPYGTYIFKTVNLLVASNNEIYIAKNYNDSSYSGNDTITTQGIEDIVISKYDSSGNVTWYHTIGSSATETHYGITEDNNGNIYCVFYVSPNCLFDGGPFVSTGGTVVAKFNSEGNLIDYHLSTVYLTCVIKYLASENRVILVANYHNTWQYDAFSFPAPPSPHHNFVVLKLDTALSAVSATNFGGNSSANVTTIDCQLNKIYLAGIADTLLVIGNDTLNTQGNRYTIFTTVLDNNAFPVWSRNFVNSTYTNEVVSIVNNQTGSFYLGMQCGSPVYYYGSSYSAQNVGKSAYVFKFNDVGLITDVLETSKTDDSFQLQVNVNSGIIYFKFNENKSQGTLKIFSADYKLVDQKKFEGKECIYKNETIPTGVYFFNIVSGDGSFFKGEIILIR